MLNDVVKKNNAFIIIHIKIVNIYMCVYDRVDAKNTT